MTAIAEADVLGVSTQRVERLLETLGQWGIWKSRVPEIVADLAPVVEVFRQRPLTLAYPYVRLDALVMNSRARG